MRAAILTVSTSVARGESDDLSGPKLAAALHGMTGAEIVTTHLLPDDGAEIAEWLHTTVTSADAPDLILTTGGTGFTPDDVTPEATSAVIDRPAPGLAEAMRARSLQSTPMGMLSRGVSGIAGRTLIVNFPGSPNAVDELLPVIAPVLEHAVGTLNRPSGANTHAPRPV